MRSQNKNNKLANEYKEFAIKAFFEKNFDLALKYFAIALSMDEENTDLKMGAILSDFAKEDQKEAEFFFDLYFSSEISQREKLYEEILDTIFLQESIIGDSFFSSLVEEVENIAFNIFEDGVEYKDFLEIAKQRGDIKRSLEDIMFSSKIIINSKEELADFINLLIEYDFESQAIVYLENALNIFPGEKIFEEKFKQIAKKRKLVEKTS